MVTTTLNINFAGTKLLAAIKHKHTWIIREAIKIEKYLDALNKQDNRLHLYPAWKMVISALPTVLRLANSNQLEAVN